MPLIHRLTQWTGLLAVSVSTAAAAVSITTFSPQGEVRDIQQVRATFSAPMVRLGNLSAPSPFDIACAAKGEAHWVDDRTWVMDFHQGLPADTACRFTVRANVKSVKGEALSGTKQFRFSTGPLAVEQIQPYEGDAIEEDQVFLLRFNGRVTRSVPLFCQVEDSPERIPTVRLAAADKAKLIEHFREQKHAARIDAVRCAQRLPAGKKMTLVLDRPGSREAQSFDYKVREAFSASFSCRRENAQAACIPLQQVTLAFTSPVPRKLAEKIVLDTPDGDRKPDFERDDGKTAVSEIRFKPPFALNESFKLRLPSGFQDETGRNLSNASSFPLKFKTADAPPLAKFAAAPFGIVELNAEPAVAVTLRDVEAGLKVKSVKVGLGALVVKDDRSIMRWLAKIERYHESHIPYDELGREPRRVRNADGEWETENHIQSRRLSLLEHERSAKQFAIPAKPDKNGKWPFTVVGIPAKEPGLHVLELKSQLLGQALLGENEPMYVRTAALVTNLSVHLKQGRENAAVWVTTLDKGKPVPHADVRIYDCRQTLLWSGRTAANGLALARTRLEGERYCGGGSLDGLIAIARVKDAHGREDVSLVRSEWNQGIESWRFPVPTDTAPRPTVLAHTVFDRTLFRAGEIVSMKHFIRIETARGFNLPRANQLPNEIQIVHDGSGQEYTFPLSWRRGRYAESTFAIPKEATLGRYSVTLQRKGQRERGEEDEAASIERDGIYLASGNFRVEEFRLPVMRGQIDVPAKAGIAPKALPLSVSMNYGTGGPAKNLPLEVSAMLRQRYHYDGAYEAFRFTAPESLRGEAEKSLDGKVVLDKATLVLDGNGNGKVAIQNLPTLDRSYDLVIEATYTDPNGEIQTLSRSVPLWPSAVRVGIAVDDWVSVGKTSALKAIVVDSDNKPVAGRKVRVKAVRHDYLSTRKRLVGGFYAYDHEERSEDLGSVCSGTSDARGLVFCELDLEDEGSIELIAETEDAAGNPARAAQSVWVSKQGELWFDTDNNDRIDVLAEKTSYEAGEMARLQVRMPFRKATALVAVEREGIIETRIVELEGKEPVIELKIKPEWGPNVFVSVLAVRGRIQDVPWYSFFTWGWRAPVKWWQAFWGEGREFQAPTAMVDLSKPAFKFGMTELNVGIKGHRLAVTVTPDKPIYSIRKTATVRIQVKLPDGKPAPAGTEVAFAAVDEALLELQPNDSWDLLKAMLQRRSYGIETATAQLQVVGKRHFGRKSLAPGGGGGNIGTRELLDTLLLWNPNVKLDARGMATVAVPINDALTRFRLVAVADSGDGLFGTGSNVITVTQAVQISSGLPPLVRHGDQLDAGITVRNGSQRAMTLKVEAQAEGLGALAAQTVRLPAGEAREVRWPVTVPTELSRIPWTISAVEQGGERAADKLAVVQNVEAAVPVSVLQASLRRLDGTLAIPVGLPAGAEPKRGGINVLLQDRLTGDMPAVRDWLLDYPYICLEQKTSVAVGLNDAERWAGIMRELPAYLDSDGLAQYFPAQDGSRSRGSDTLSSYLLALASESGWEIPDEPRERLLTGLALFVEGKLDRDVWMPRDSKDARRLAAMDALARYGKLNPRQLDVVAVQPNSWSTAMLIDWISILQRVPAVPEQAKKLAEAEQILRGRLTYQGTKLQFSTEKDDYWWWLMHNGDVNAARLLLTVRDLPAWKDDMPRLLSGLIGRQRRGVWWTTNANAWGSVAVRRFAEVFDTVPVSGVTAAALGEAKQGHTWPGTGGTPIVAAPLTLPWPAQGQGTLNLVHDGTGKPWATVQVSAALPLKAPLAAGYTVKKTVTPLTQKTAGVFARGDVLRVKLTISAQADMTWVVVDDPIPAGATIMGSGLGRDSQIATEGEQRDGWTQPAFVERRFGVYRAYYEYVPRGEFSVEYSVRLNNAGSFRLPPTRVQAMYAPDVFGASPNAVFKVGRDQ